MKSVLISIQPKWCELIASGKKTIEVRKTAPKLQTPFMCYIYCTKDNYELVIDCLKRVSRNTLNFGMSNKIVPDKDLGYYCLNGKVIGEFVCDRIDEFHEWQLQPGGKFQEAEQKDLDLFLKLSCLPYDEICGYRKNLPYFKPLYGWHITDLKIYDEPKELWEFRHYVGCENSSKLCCMCKYSTRDCNGILDCQNRVERPPQSYCFVESL